MRQDLVHLFPVDVGFVRSPTQPFVPYACDLAVETGQGREITGDAVVPVVSHQLAGQGVPLLLHGVVPVFPAILRDSA